LLAEVLVLIPALKLRTVTFGVVVRVNDGEDGAPNMVPGTAFNGRAVERYAHTL